MWILSVPMQKYKLQEQLDTIDFLAKILLNDNLV